MQVMPATARDPGFGLRPANPNDAADMNRLGREYRAKMEQRYGGDYSKMWAAYNAGPGAVDKAIAGFPAFPPKRKITFVKTQGCSANGNAH